MHIAYIEKIYKFGFGPDIATKNESTSPRAVPIRAEIRQFETVTYKVH